MKNVTNTLISGDPMKPSQFDLIAQVASLPTTAAVPDGWRVMTGDVTSSRISRVAFRYEIKEGK